jgi:hypothetical protein
MFEYLINRIQDKYIRDELRKWQDYFTKSGVAITGHRVELRGEVVTLKTDKVVIRMTRDQATALSEDIRSLVVEQSIRGRGPS